MKNRQNKKYIIILLTFLILVISLLTLFRYKTNNECQNTNNQQILLKCIVNKDAIIKKQDYNFSIYKKIIENHYDFVFAEYDKSYLEHDIELFQKNYYLLANLCNFDKKCILDEKKYFLSKLICLSYSKACFLQSRFKMEESSKKIQLCESNKKCESISKNLSYLINFLNDCKKYKGEDMFNQSELINYFNKQKQNICKNYKLDYQSKELEILRGNFDRNYEFIEDSKLESLR